ncbi:MAG: fasciclin domain-containing protein [Bacteroidota bacterium]
MKVSFNILKVLALCLPFLVFQSCQQENVSPESSRVAVSEETAISFDMGDDIQELAQQDPNVATERTHWKRPTFNTLNQAIACAGLSSALFSGKKTVYAPSDEAFAKLGLNASNICSALDTETLTNILLYHVNGELLTLRTRGCVKQLNGDVARVDFRHHRYFINDARFTFAFSQNGHGYLLNIYAIDAVLMPPANNIVETAIAADGFNSLVAAVLAADPAIAAALSDDDAVYTVFAPTDKAFADLLGALGASSLEDAVATIGVSGLSTVLLYHVVDGCATSNDLKDKQMFTTLQGETVTVDLRGTHKGIVDKTGTTAPFVRKGLNILTANGFIHTIDKVLLPQAVIDAL